MKSIKNILVATDFSSDSDFAIEEAAWLAKKFHSKLRLLRMYRLSEKYRKKRVARVSLYL